MTRNTGFFTIINPSQSPFGKVGGKGGFCSGLWPLRIEFLIILSAVIYSSNAQAQSVDLDEIVAKLQKNYLVMNDYEAGFTQETKISAYPRALKSSGKVFYKKPGRMRWDYELPEKREIVTDSKTLWMYTPSLNQVIKADFSMTSQSRAAQAFLSGMGNLKEDFNIALAIEDAGDADYRLVLTPKAEKDTMKSLILAVDRSNYNVRKSEMTDLYDNVTIVIFENLRINRGLDDSVFDFEVPEGVEVVAPPAIPQEKNF